MRRSLTATAILCAFAGVANAQSAVRISGAVDLGIRRVGIDTAAGPADQWLMQTGGSPRSSVNFSGEEDLGAGLQTFFFLNHRFNPDDGTINQRGNGNNGPAGSTQFWRNSWVGMRGSLGEVRLGRMMVPLHDFNGPFEPWNGGDTVATVHTNGVNTPPRENHMVYYKSPVLSGFQAVASVASRFGQSNLNGVNNDGPKTPIGYGIRYDSALFSVAFAQDRSDKDVKTTGLYGKVNIGNVLLATQYERGDQGLPTTGPRIPKNKHISVSARITAGLFLVKVGYLRNFDEQLNGGTLVYAAGKHNDKLGLGFDYALSKRTFLYADVSKRYGDATAGAKVTNLDAGILHRF